MRDCCIILFVKYPEKSKIKTRLAKDINEDFVLELYKFLVIDILFTINKSNYDFKIFFDPPGYLSKMKNWLGDQYSFIEQNGKDLGEKMKNAFLNIFEDNYNKAIIIGSDIPDISDEILLESLNRLENNEAVIGPTFGGGYYLIGFKKDSFLDKVFYGINWSTNTVFNLTMKIFKQNKYNTYILKKLNDIDTIYDLKKFIKQNKNNNFKNSNAMKYILKHKGI